MFSLTEHVLIDSQIRGWYHSLAHNVFDNVPVSRESGADSVQPVPTSTREGLLKDTK